MSLSERARVALRMATERLSKLQDELSAVRTENTRLQEENGALRRQSDEQATEIAVLRCEMETLRAEQLQGPRRGRSHAPPSCAAATSSAPACPPRQPLGRLLQRSSSPLRLGMSLTLIQSWRR